MDRHDIKAAIHRAGGTMLGIATANGLDESTVRSALRRPVAAGEAAVSEFLNIPAQELWPDRYDRDGTRQVRRGRLSRTQPKGHVALSQRQNGGGA